MLRSVLFWVAAAAVTASWGSHNSDCTVVALSMGTTTAAQQQPSSIESGVATQRAAVPTSAFTTAATTSRRRAIGWIASTVTTATVVSFESDGGSTLCRAAEPVDRFNVEDYLKTGMVMNPMGVSGQAGTSTVLLVSR
jgi:hypothetical protein